MRKVSILLLAILISFLQISQASSTDTITSRLDYCKIVNKHPDAHQKMGWPRDVDTLPSIGKVKLLIVALDFEDSPASSFKIAELPRRMQLGTIKSFYREVSNGQFDPEFEIFPFVIRMPKTSEKYGNSVDSDVVTGGEFATHLMIHDALNQVQSQLDLFQFSGVIALVTGGHSLSGRVALALSEDHDISQRVPGGIHNEIVVGDRALDSNGVAPWRMLVHEINHLLGIPDLYLYAPDGYWQGKSPGPFGQQGFLRGDSASDSLAYNRWLNGWIPDKKVLCLANFADGTKNVKLVPQKIVSGGYELLLIRISENKVIALETPKNKGFLSRTSPNSLLIYSVDSNIAIGEGPVRLIPKHDEISSRPLSPDLPDWQRYQNAALLRGENIKYGNFVFANRQSKKSGSHVNLTILAGRAIRTQSVLCRKGEVQITFHSYFAECPTDFVLIP